MQSLKESLGLVDEENQADKCECCITLTYEQRVYGFLIAFGLGWFLSFLSAFFVLQIARAPQKFALCYTFGAITSICSTMFLWGPMSQFKKMIDPHRLAATATYFTMMALTLWAAFGRRSPGLVILFLFLQLLAMCWYTITYIPYGQTMLKNFLTSMCT